MTGKPSIGLLVTDLDNTLYDWVTFFTSAFYAMVDVAVELLEVPREVLLDELQTVHRAHHNSEQPFALLETPAVQRRLSGLARREQARALDPAFKAFNEVRDRTLVLYPGVVETLQSVAASGCRVVAHTEASVANARFRLTKLRLARFFDGLYAVEDRGLGHPAPEAASPFEALAAVRAVSLRRRKPDPGVLVEICGDVGVPVERTLYVGDSIARDVGMARAAHAWAAWAEYGTRFDRDLWDRLVRVTHWSDEDRRRASEAQERYGHTQPHVVLHDSFAELLGHFEFRAAATAAVRQAL